MLMRGFFLALALAGFSFAAHGAAEDEVVVTSPHWQGIKDETALAFSAWHEKKYGWPATVRWRDIGGGGSQIVRFLRSEYKASPSAGVDVFYGGGVDPYTELKQSGLLTRYDPPTDILSQIPPTLNGMPLMDPDHEWFGTCLSAFGIITNERAREAAGLPEALTWSALTDPRLVGWISASDPRASSSALAIYEIILQAYGWDTGWAALMEMSGNVRHFLSSSAASAVEVGVGDAAYGVAVDVYGQAQAGFYGPKNVSFVVPVGETVITPDCIAILKNPPQLEMAQHFVEFALSREGQSLWMLPKGAPGGAKRYVINRMCVWPSLYDELKETTPITASPFNQANTTLVYDSKLASKRRAILSVLLAASMIDTHDELVRAWKALQSPAAQKLSAERRAALLAEFVAPPCSQDELLQLVASDWGDPIRRTALINRWQNEALERYKSVLAQIPSS